MTISALASSMPRLGGGAFAGVDRPPRAPLTSGRFAGPRRGTSAAYAGREQTSSPRRDLATRTLYPPAARLVLAFLHKGGDGVTHRWPRLITPSRGRVPSPETPEPETITPFDVPERRMVRKQERHETRELWSSRGRSWILPTAKFEHDSLKARPGLVSWTRHSHGRWVVSRSGAPKERFSLPWPPRTMVVACSEGLGTLTDAPDGGPE